MRVTTASLLAALLTISGGCTSAYNQHRLAIEQDDEICSRYGAGPRSLVYADCLVLQQQRREAATARQNELIQHATAVTASSGRY